MSVEMLIFVGLPFIAVVALVVAWVRMTNNEMGVFRAKIGYEEVKGYCNKTFGVKGYNVYREDLDGDGMVIFLVYQSSNQWMKSPQHDWYRVYQNNGMYKHMKVEGI